MRCLLLPTVLVVAILAGCSAHSGQEVSTTSLAVGKALREGRAVRLSDHTAFAWDTVRIYSPYTSRRDICHQIENSWSQCPAALPETISEGDFLLVFTLKERYAAHELHSRRNGDYCEQSCALVLSATEASFSGQASATSSYGQVRYVLRRTAASPPTRSS